MSVEKAWRAARPLLGLPGVSGAWSDVDSRALDYLSQYDVVDPGNQVAHEPSFFREPAAVQALWLTARESVGLGLRRADNEFADVFARTLLKNFGSRSADYLHFIARYETDKLNALDELRHDALSQALTDALHAELAPRWAREGGPRIPAETQVLVLDVGASTQYDDLAKAVPADSPFTPERWEVFRDGRLPVTTEGYRMHNSWHIQARYGEHEVIDGQPTILVPAPVALLVLEGERVAPEVSVPPAVAAILDEYVGTLPHEAAHAEGDLTWEIPFAPRVTARSGLLGGLNELNVCGRSADTTAYAVLAKFHSDHALISGRAFQELVPSDVTQQSRAEMISALATQYGSTGALDLIALPGPDLSGGHDLVRAMGMLDGALDRAVEWELINGRGDELVARLRRAEVARARDRAATNPVVVADCSHVGLRLADDLLREVHDLKGRPGRVVFDDVDRRWCVEPVGATVATRLPAAALNATARRGGTSPAEQVQSMYPAEPRLS